MSAINQDKIDKLIAVANDFGAIAQKVNESSKIRKKYAEEAIALVDPSFKTCEELLTTFQTNSKLANDYIDIFESLEQSIKDLLNMTQKQSKNIEKADKSPDCTEYKKNISDLQKASKDGHDIIKGLSKENKEIVSMYEQIIKNKQAEKRNIMQLMVITEVVEQEAQKAISGSESNLKRGKQLNKNFQSVSKLIEAKDINALTRLVEEANAGWTLAEDVNKNSKSQIIFAENFSSFSKNLQKDSQKSEKKVMEKVDTLKRSGEKLKKLGEIISDKMSPFPDKAKASKSFVSQNSTLMEAEKGIVENVKMISGAKLFESKYINTNNQLQKATNALTKKESDYFIRLSDSVEAMTEATKYPMEGSAKNIENGKFLESALKEIISKIK